MGKPDQGAAAAAGARRATGDAAGNGRGGRFSARRKRETVLRLLRGEDLESVSRELGITAARASQWRDQFLAAGQASLKSRAPDARDEANRRLQAKNLTASTAGITALALVMLGFTALRIPQAGTPPLAVKEGSFWLQLRDDPAREGTTSIRIQTDPSTIVLIREPVFQTTSFKGRSLLVPSEGARPTSVTTWRAGTSCWTSADTTSACTMSAWACSIPFTTRPHLIRRYCFEVFCHTGGRSLSCSVLA